MDQTSPTRSGSESTTTKRNRRMSQVNEDNILVGSDSQRKRKRVSNTDGGDYLPSLEGRATSPTQQQQQAPVSAGQLAAQQIATTPEEFEQVREKAMILYEKLMTQRDPNNYDRFLHEHFLELPDPTLIPSYYSKIKKPVCLNQIKQRLDSHSYPSLSDAKTDMNQIFVNAKRFNQRESLLFMDAKKLHKNLRANYAYLIGEAPPPEEDEPLPYQRRNRRASSSVAPGAGSAADGDYVDNSGVGTSTGSNQKRGPTLKPWLLRKFDQLTRKSEPTSGRFYSEVFKSLPDKRSWPEYYQFIQNPISLDNVLTKINSRKYRNVTEFKQDVERSFQNALFFNEEGSQIWQDAQTMLEHFKEIMKEQPPKFAPPRKYNTARRRAEMENARLNGTIYVENDDDQDLDNNDNNYGGGRSKSIGVGGEGGGGDDQSQIDSEDGREEDESDNGGGGGDYSTGYVEGEGEYDTSTMNFDINNVLGDSIPVFDNLPIPTTATTIPDQTASQLDALTSLANLASSLSPQRQPSISLPPALSTSNSFNGNGNSSLNFLNNSQIVAPLTNTATDTSSTAAKSLGLATVGNFSPKALARLPMNGEIPLITSFRITSDSASSSSFELENSQTRQHSISLSNLPLSSPSPSRQQQIVIEPIYRLESGGGGGGAGGGNSVVRVSIETSSRRAEGLDSPTSIDEQTGNPSKFDCTLRKGLNALEFRVKEPFSTNLEGEVYRIFILK
ncbi:hypothetical protein JCM3765_005668 [Sporobolomyces pararoseus]